MPTAVVTGATGFIGINVVSLLLERGWRVIALHRASSNIERLQRLGAERRVAAVGDAAALRAAVPEGADVLFHLAANMTFQKATREAQYQDNVVGTQNVVEAALAQRVGRFILASSIAAYGLHEGDITEETPSTAAATDVGYYRTKYLAEQVVREGIARGLQAVVLNPANVLGPYDEHNWGRAIRMTAVGKRPGVPPGAGAFCHVRDVAEAHLAAVGRGRIGENYILAGVNASYLELFQTVARVLGVRVPARAMPRWLMMSAAPILELQARLVGRAPQVTTEFARTVCHRWSCSSTKAARELGYTTHTLEEMVRDSHAWLASEGLLSSSPGQDER